jgi:hypothetical protein
MCSQVFMSVGMYDSTYAKSSGRRLANIGICAVLSPATVGMKPTVDVEGIKLKGMYSDSHQPA